ncbi:ABC transporter permease [Streptodolium elevatio]
MSSPAAAPASPNGAPAAVTPGAALDADDPRRHPPVAVQDIAGLFAARERPRRPTPVAASAVFAWRAVLKMRPATTHLLEVTAFPLMMTLMFTYLFGGALAGSTDEYLQYVVPGVLVQSIVMTTMGTGLALNRDIANGVFDRFRTLPVWRPAVLVGMLVGDLLRYLLAATMILLTGLVLGFRPDGGVPGVLAAVALVLVFAFAFSWVWTTLGLLMRSEKAVAGTAMMVLFPATFLSNIFVEPETMPGWLQAFVDANPIAHLVSAVRDLAAGDFGSPETGWTLLYAAGFVAVFGTLSMRLYNRG